MLVAVNMYSLHIVHKVPYISNKVKNNNSKNSKKLSTKTILRCTPCIAGTQRDYGII